ncbi:hypothetical protein [Actinocorallia libanotica]|uniref:Excreted virulence factor EspC (Type VII ESX diderm) n=1 Tax=Actinocorallia libanotica TaxID=46162 RepID=A0ABN1RZZ3_9ACTN
MSKDRKFSELAKIEFKGKLSENFKTYSDRGERLGRRFAFELEMAAGDSRAAMETLRGHPLLFGLDARLKARRVAKRLNRAQELAAGMASEVAKFHRAYSKHFSQAGHRRKH